MFKEQHPNLHASYPLTDGQTEIILAYKQLEFLVLQEGQINIMLRNITVIAMTKKTS